MANNTITKEEYISQLRSYITNEMKELDHNHEGTKFWVQFNKDKQIEFDAQLAANGISVVE
jgi:hypothetical protein